MKKTTDINKDELPTSADKVTLLAFAASRRAAVRRRLLQQSIDIVSPRGPQQQTRRALHTAAVDRWDRQTEIRDLYILLYVMVTALPV